MSDEGPPTRDEDLTSVPPDDDPEEIQPALTAEEWAVIIDALKHDEPLDAILADYLEDPHRLAAIALHGQPFGFTHAMAAALSHFVRLWTDPGYVSDPNPDVVEQAQRGIAAIRALLPPRP